VRTILLGSKEEELTNPPGVAPLIVVPCDELDEVLVELDPSASVEDRGVLVADKVGGHDSVLSVIQNAFERASCSLLHSRLDLVIGSLLLDTRDEINHRDVGDRDTEGKTTGRRTLQP
jgi:hypothetical protein